MLQSPVDFLARTRSAASKLFAGIEDYRRNLREGIKGSTFVGNGADRAEFDAQYRQWAHANRELVERSMAAQREFHSEKFAKATLCGAVLELAWKAIELYSTNSAVPESVKEIVGSSDVGAKFALGREVRGVPIGLVIYAGRNQHVHFNENKLGRLNRAVIEKMAEDGHPGRKSPELDLKRFQGQSLASNVLYLLGWDKLETYEEDMRVLLSPFDEASAAA